MSELPKTYDAAAAERRWSQEWERAGLFTAGRRTGAEPFVVMIPPPNVTGVLHMGHALNGAIQDVLVRFQRMRGRDVLWIPGTDHAGIATQAVVERKLFKEKGLKRHEMGREAFLAEIWAWKEEHGGIILKQFRALGCSCDWTRTAFTMDENLSRGVREAFIRLWEKGLIYRGARMVNWDCVLKTAVGDDEVEDVERKGHLWTLRYPLADGSGHLSVATTRPETMLGDTGVAVHPEDARYREFVGKQVRLPLLGRLIPIVADDSVDPAFGTGAVKVTPGHDPADYERGQRHGLPLVSILHPDGTLNAAAGPYAGLSREAARKRVLADLDAQGLLEKTEEHLLRIPISDRSNSPIEPLISEQWFVRMEPLARPAIAAVKEGSLRLVPERWTKVYLDWLENVRDWCISRQLWWGHPIPVWYDADDLPAASRTPLALGDPHPISGKPIVRQDEDVLDTWASSWLWPFSTLGWPDEQAADLKRYYPTHFLSTAREIIYLWVARMVMAGYEFLDRCPFSDVYIHATVLDAQGRRMSKSAGNGIDPLEMIRQYGADAVRFTLLILTTEGQDVKLAPTKFELGRNFMNKVWNAARYVLSSAAPETRGGRPGTDLTDRWIASRAQGAVQEIGAALGAYRFHDAAQALYRFVWDDFCDWYLEASKRRIQEGEPGCGATLWSVLGTIVRLLQPFAPFLAAELAEHLGEAEPAALLPWPEAGERDPRAEAEMERLQGVIRAARKLRNENRIGEAERVEVSMRTADPAPLLAYAPLIRELARLSAFHARPDLSRPPAAATEVLGKDEVYLSLAGHVDLEAERERKGKEIEKAQALQDSIEARLRNADFLAKAKPEVVERERDRAAEARERVARLREALESLG
ncbi:MAG: valine--tRNA ligase [Planctomycetaceae bacterium]